MPDRHAINRRNFLKHSAGAAFAFSIVPRHVLGGPGQTPPSERFGGALIGCGGRGPGTFNQMKGWGLDVDLLAACEVHEARLSGILKRYPGSKGYTDFRRVLDRKDIDIVAIATPPHWHALISIAAMEAGKDVLCEKPMTRFIAEGRAVVEAEKRTNQIFQVGTFGRLGACRSNTSKWIHKAMRSGLIKDCTDVHIKKGGLKVKQWSGKVNTQPHQVPDNLHWDMYCGPSPLRPYHPHRHGGTHRGYWDYDGGGLADMGQHHFDPIQWIYGKDDTSPVEIEACAPPAHPEACGMWGWVELKYADGLTFVMDSREWGEPYSRKQEHRMSPDSVDEDLRRKVDALPDPEPLLNFGQAVKTRKKPGGHAEAAHRCATLLHLANAAIRTGRKLRYDPVKEQFIGDEQANRLVDQPMRTPWHL